MGSWPDIERLRAKQHQEATGQKGLIMEGAKIIHTLKARVSLLHTAADLQRKLKIPDVTTSLSAIMISTTEKKS